MLENDDQRSFLNVGAACVYMKCVCLCWSWLQLKLTPEYLELRRFEAVMRNTKLYFGPSIPTMFLKEWSAEGEISAVTDATSKQEVPFSKS